MNIEDLIPKALLAALEEKDVALVHTTEGWITIPNSSLLINSNLTVISQKLDQLLAREEDKDKKF